MKSRASSAFLAGLLLLICGACQTNSSPGSVSEKAESPSPSPSPTPKSFTMAAVGDVLTHEGLAIRARKYAGSKGGFDFRPMFEKVKPALSAADVAVCNVESPISKNNQNLSYYPRFHVPHEIALAVVDSGFDVCSTANNHAIDVGPDGVVETLEALDAAHLAHAGTGRTPEEASKPAMLEVKGLRLAFLSYTFSLNGLTLPADKKWMVNLIDSARMLADARSAKAAGAQFVVVSIHWGTEYQADPNEQQRRVAEDLLKSPDVDLILGSHVHVIQPVAKVGEKFVLYGMGNFISRQAAYCCPAETQDGVIFHFAVEEVPGGAVVRKVSYTPTWVEPSTFRIVSVAEALDDPSTAATNRKGLEISWRRTTSAVKGEQFGITTTSVPKTKP
jgi:capsule synthesis protein PGA_cap